MIDADSEALEQLLADDLTWTHSSGVTETKAEFIAAIVAQRVVYQRLEVEQDRVRDVNPLYVHEGTLKGVATRDGQVKVLRAKFLAIWRKVETSDTQLQLIAWQSTNCDV